MLYLHKVVGLHTGPGYTYKVQGKKDEDETKQIKYSRDCRGMWILECNEWQLFANSNYGLQGSYLMLGLF